MTLQLESVTKSYGKAPGIEEISFSISEGEVVGFVGANGAGKTTTLKAILNFHLIQKGSIRIFGVPHFKKESRSNVGFLAERPYFHDGLLGLEFLEFYGGLSGMKRAEAAKRAQELMELVRLPHMAHRKLSEYSKGMTQRMGIAQAIIHRPKLVILDEPMSGLDPVGRLEVRTLLEDLKRQGTTIFFSSHILPDIEAICDRAIVIHKGRLVESKDGRSFLQSRIKYFEWLISGISRDKVRENFPKARFLGSTSSGVVLQIENMGEREVQFQTHQIVQSLGGKVERFGPVFESLEDTIFQLSRNETVGRDV